MKAKRYNRAFTLVEVLVVIGVISILGGTGYVATQNLKQTSDETKLAQDVAQINNAIQLHQLQTTNALGSTGQAVLLSLQTRADAASAGKTVGLKSSVLDERVEAPMTNADGSRCEETWQSSAEAASGKLRAYWDSTNKAFTTARSGPAGIKKFRFKGSIPTVAATEARTPLHVAAASGWVWSNNATQAVDMNLGVTPGTGNILGNVGNLPGYQGFPGGYWTVGPSGIVPVSYVYREAGYTSTLALFSLEGMGPDVYNLDTPEGQRDFLIEAIRRVIAGDRAQTIIDTTKDVSIGSGTPSNQLQVESNKEFVFRPGDTVAAIMIPNGTMAAALSALNNLGTLPDGSTRLQNLATTNGQVFPLTSLSRTNDITNTATNFPFYANQYASLGSGTSAYAIEDTANGGDSDFNDLVFKATGMTAPEGSTTNIIDPLTYYAHWDNPTTTTVENINKLDAVGTNGGMTLRQALTAAGVIQ